MAYLPSQAPLTAPVIILTVREGGWPIKSRIKYAYCMGSQRGEFSAVFNYFWGSLAITWMIFVSLR